MSLSPEFILSENKDKEDEVFKMEDDSIKQFDSLLQKGEMLKVREGIINLNCEIEKLRKSHIIKAKELEDTQQKLKQANQDLKILENITETSMEALTVLNCHQNSLVDQLNNLEEKRVRIESEITTYDQEMESSQNEFEKHLEELQLKANEKDAQICEQHSKLESLSMHMQEAHDQLQNFENHIKSYEQQLSDKKNENANLIACIQEKEKLLQNMQKECEMELYSKNEANRKSLQMLNDEIGKLRNNENLLTKRNIDLETKLQEVSLERESQQKDISDQRLDWSNQLNQLCTEKQTLEVKIMELNNKINSIENEMEATVTSLTSEKDKEKANAIQLEELNLELNTQLTNKMEDNKRLNNQYKKCENIIKQLEIHIKQLEDKLLKTDTSFSGMQKDLSRDSFNMSNDSISTNAQYTSSTTASIFRLPAKSNIFKAKRLKYCVKEDQLSHKEDN